MSYFCSFPPKVTFPGCSEEFLFPVAKIRNIYHIDNQFVIILSLFRDCPYIEKTQEPITDYIYNGFEEKSNYKSSNTILITYKSKQYRLHTGDRILNKIKSGDFPKLYYSSKTDYLFFEGDYLPAGYAQATLLFTIILPTIGTLIWRKELDNDIRTM